MSIYIRSAKQISNQQPLSDSWFDTPMIYDRVYVRALDPDFKKFLAPNVARRLGKILKRALITAKEAIAASGIEMPDAIISGTGLGCIENTEIFLDAMVKEGEEFLQPTHFMQSTHNTISSLIAIDTKCHGYNNTYVHKGVSFDSALMDALSQMHLGMIHSALVGGYDEMTPSYQLLLSRVGYWRADGETVSLRRGEEAFAGETSTSFMLSDTSSDDTLCQIDGIEMMYHPTIGRMRSRLSALLSQNGLTEEDIDAVIVGTSGNQANDAVYHRNIPELFPGKPVIGYKHIFGESYTASALALYTGALILKRQSVPDIFIIDGGMPTKLRHILLYNQADDADHSFTLISK